MVPLADFQAARDAAVVTLPPNLGLIEVSGTDAGSFLQGQLSSDVAALGTGEAQYSSFNSPKGRMLANFLLWRESAEQFRMLLVADLAAATARRLGMFVLRAKAIVRDLTASHAFVGVGGPKAAAATTAVFGNAPAPGRIRADTGTTVGLPDGRIVVVLATGDMEGVLKRFAAHAATVDPSIFDWLGIEAGVPLITAATTDQFVPQTANWELLGGVAFDKGCYTGQEIVARMQYLGRLKERLFGFLTNGTVSPATRLYSHAFGEQACGTVINAAPAPGGGTAFLAVVQTAAVDAADVRAGGPDGPVATLRPLPYALPAPNVPRGRIA
jgi:tRNA-modifying protein YgfZ